MSQVHLILLSLLLHVHSLGFHQTVFLVRQGEVKLLVMIPILWAIRAIWSYHLLFQMKHLTSKNLTNVLIKPHGTSFSVNALSSNDFIFLGLNTSQSSLINLSASVFVDSLRRSHTSCISPASHPHNRNAQRSRYVPSAAGPTIIVEINNKVDNYGSAF